MVSTRRTDMLLALGMLAGAALAALGLARDAVVATRGLPPGAVAVVNGEPISRESLETALALVARDRKAPLTGDEKRQVLDRLVDEELLLQRAIALGLPRSDRKIRGELVASVIDAAAGGEPREPGEAELRAFYDENAAAFAGPPPLRVAQVFVAVGPRSDDEARARAEAAAGRLRGGEDLAAVRRALGDPPAVELPPSFVPASRLRDVLGPAAAEAALALPAGEVSEPQRSADGYRVLVVLERGQADPAPFESRRADVLGEFRRRRGEAALQAELASLRRDADIVVAPAVDADSR
jgi:parvulin-like peptidyl-prolyl isomerase